jgi:hypothetical protein
MRSDQQTVNGLTAYKLGTSQTTIEISVEISTTLAATCYAGIRVFVRHADGSETELTAGTPVAQVSRTASGSGIQSNTWNCPQTVLQSTDAIVVRVYLKSGTGAWNEVAVFITEQLNAQSLDAMKWTVYYYTSKYRDVEGAWYWAFYFGTSTYNSRIENFGWAPAGILVRIIADTEVWGWASSASSKIFRDSGVSGDYMCRLPAKKFIESVVGFDWVRRASLVRLAESVIGVERFVKSVWKVYADSYVGSDKVARCVGKPFLDYSTVSDYLYRTAFWIRSAVESVKGVERFRRDILKRMMDSSVLAERLRKVPFKVLADVGKLIDSFGKGYQIIVEADTATSGWTSVASLKVLRDSSVSGDYMCKEPVKRLVEAVHGVDWWYKLVGKGLADAILGVDWYGKFLLRHFADAGLSVDYVRRGVVKRVWDYPFVHEYLFKWVARMKPILESVVCSEWYSKDVLRCFADAGLGVDRVAKEPSKALLDFGIALELFQIAGWVYIELRDFLVGEHVPVKDVTSCKADTNVSTDFLAKDVLRHYVDAVLTADYVRRLGLKALADVGVGFDFAARTPSKALIDSGVWFDWYSKDVVRNFLEWVVNVDWAILPALKLVVLRDWVVGEHIPLKDVGKVEVESVASVDWKSFDLTSCLIDAVRGLDGVYRYIPVELRDYLQADYEIGFGRVWTVKDRAKMEELVAKLGFTLMGQEVWRRVYHRVWYDLIEVADQNTKIVIAQALIDAFKALYDKLKG